MVSLSGYQRPRSNCIERNSSITLSFILNFTKHPFHAFHFLSWGEALGQFSFLFYLGPIFGCLSRADILAQATMKGRVPQQRVERQRVSTVTCYLRLAFTPDLLRWQNFQIGLQLLCICLWCVHSSADFMDLGAWVLSLLHGGVRCWGGCIAGSNNFPMHLMS